MTAEEGHTGWCDPIDGSLNPEDEGTNYVS